MLDCPKEGLRFQSRLFAPLFYIFREFFGRIFSCQLLEISFYMKLSAFYYLQLRNNEILIFMSLYLLYSFGLVKYKKQANASCLSYIVKMKASFSKWANFDFCSYLCSNSSFALKSLLSVLAIPSTSNLSRARNSFPTLVFMG